MPCPACLDLPYDLTPTVIIDSRGQKHTVPAAFMGAEARIEDCELIAMMEREWSRPLPEKDPVYMSGVSARAALVIIYWTYFKTRVRRLIDIGLSSLPANVRQDLDSRYDSVCDHMDRLYKILFGVKYVDDLEAAGAAESAA